MKKTFYKIMKWTRRGFSVFKRIRRKLAMSMGLTSTMMLAHTTSTNAMVGEILQPKVNDAVTEMQNAVNILGILAIIVIGYMIFFSKSKNAAKIAVGVIAGYIIIFGAAQIWTWIQS
ncbi:TrbC/VirB2 family protein [Breznakia pachnodae]|uniref:Type IV secretory pathway VirB2 component (Pilin) n=1 Tax=Breznakia pachnodae TaxID=265178 RepID=A0ABU0DZX0_9FIRM|nr:TrbC/VirB2 family protein [Breznakia pachnodae]MDQ0359991.1 type IV secretory pathway VirB2 component (pilin) [Breznakia pachnodae]